MAKTDILDRATSILETINAVFGSEGVGLPDRQYITVGGTGTSVHDCEQVTVSFEAAKSGLPGNDASIPENCPTSTAGVYGVEIVRCIPTSGGQARSKASIAPSEESLIDSATQQMIDAGVLLEVGKTVVADDSYITVGSFDVSVGQASGGFQAIILALNVTV